MSPTWNHEESSVAEPLYTFPLLDASTAAAFLSKSIETERHRSTAVIRIIGNQPSTFLIIDLAITITKEGRRRL